MTPSTPSTPSTSSAASSPARSIRPIARDDVPALQAIDTVAHGEHWSARLFRDEVERDDRVHLVAEAGMGVIGHAAAHIDGPSCRITNVAVGQDYTGRGHGSALLMSLVRTVLAEHRVAHMQLEVRPTNRRAQRLYSQFGFAPVGVERGFYHRSDALGSRDAVIMMVADVHAAPFRDRLDQIEADLVERDQQRKQDEGAAA